MLADIFEALAKAHGEWFGWDNGVSEVFQKIADALR